jgi:nitroimidazol reductase NimA-like FMN-containing flavoprotein (pyridoxamine 5'-phosphate oxidase superfamily)
MPTPKRTSKKQVADQAEGPVASRPYMPGYGVPKSKKGLLPWSHVTQRMTEARHYWVCVVSPTGQPHATPVDGLWLDDRLYFGGSPQTRRHRYLAANPAVCIHLESGLDVVTMQGEAHELRVPDRALSLRLAEASAQKYGYGSPPEAYEAGGVFVFRPRLVFAWSQFLKDATRWQFQDEE